MQNTADGSKHAGFRGDRPERMNDVVDGKYNDDQIALGDTGEGLMLKFNEVMAAYVQQFWDTSVSKIYAPLIDAPANGAFNQEVFKAKGWPDIEIKGAGYINQRMKELRGSTDMVGSAVSTGVGKQQVDNEARYLYAYILAETFKVAYSRFVAISDTPSGDFEGSREYLANIIKETLDDYAKNATDMIKPIAKELWAAAHLNPAGHSTAGTFLPRIILLHDLVNVVNMVRNLSNDVMAIIYSTQHDNPHVSVSYQLQNVFNNSAVQTALDSGVFTKARTGPDVAALLAGSAALGNETEFVKNMTDDYKSYTAGTILSVYKAAVGGNYHVARREHKIPFFTTIAQVVGVPGAFTTKLEAVTQGRATGAARVGAGFNLAFSRAMSRYPGVPTTPAEEGKAAYFATFAASPAGAFTDIAAEGWDIPSMIPNVNYVHASYGEPKEILFATISKIMRTALTDASHGTKPNLIQTMSEVPIRMKENLKANLPIFKELFQLINKRAILLKGMTNIGINLSRYSGVASLAPVDGVHGGLDEYCSKSNRDSKAFYSRILDKLTSSCSSMISTISKIMNELNDSPVYFEVSDNSIVDYKHTNSKLPFMPTSNMLITLSNTRSRNLTYPIESTGADIFSFNYGTRSALHNYDDKQILEKYPGMKHILDEYNTAARQNAKIDESVFDKSNARHVDLIRYTASTRIYSTLFGALRNIVEVDYKPNRPVYQDDRQVSEIVAMVNGTITTAVEDFAAFVDKSQIQTTSSRKDTSIYNIIDMNIMPINVHAMITEICFGTLYNYAFTFDSFVNDILETTGNDAAGLMADAGAISGRTALSLLSKNPYAKVSQHVYDNGVAKIAIGATPIDNYGRPKFISDQMWNKSLLNEIGDIKHDETKITPAIVVADQLTKIVSKSAKSITTSNVEVADLRTLGRLRFDTKLARNLFFITNAQRLMQLKLDEELSKKRAVVSGIGISKRQVTSYDQLESFVDIAID